MNKKEICKYCKEYEVNCLCETDTLFGAGCRLNRAVDKLIIELRKEFKKIWIKKKL